MKDHLDDEAMRLMAELLKSLMPANWGFTVLRLGVCYFALQTLQTLDKIYRQNNSTKPLLVAGAVN